MRRLTLSLLVAAALSVPAAPARAQMRPGPDRPSPVPAGRQADRGSWFGGGIGAIGQDLTASFGGSSGEFRRMFSDPTAGQTDVTSTYRALSGNMQYSLSASRVTFSVGGGSSASSIPGVRDDTIITHRGQAGLSVQVSPRTTVGLTQGVYYEPALARYLRDIFGGGSEVGGVPPPGIDVGTAEDEAWTYTTTAQVRHQLSTRSSVSANWNRWRSDYDDDERAQSFDQAGLQFSHQIAEGLAARVGYNYGTGRTASEDETVRSDRHGLDAGIDFNRSLSLSRRTTLSFGTGTTMTRTDGDTNVFLVGNLGLSHVVGRTWNTGVTYARDVRFVEGLTDLALTDRVSVNLTGGLSRNAAVTAMASYTRGRVGLDDDGNPFEGASGSASFSLAVTENVGLSVQYGYYRSLFDGTDLLVSQSIRNFDRHSTGVSAGFWGLVSVGAQYSTYRTAFGRDESITASLSFFAPIFSRSRRPDAAR